MRNGGYRESIMKEKKSKKSWVMSEEVERKREKGVGRPKRKWERG